MPAVQRLGDINDGDGEIRDIAQGTVYANGLLIAIDGSFVESHDLHIESYTTNGSPTVFINGIPVNRQGDEDECGHTREDGSPDVYVDGANGTGNQTPTSSSSNADGSSTPPASPAIGPPNISNAAIAAVNAAVISAVLEKSFQAAPAAGLPFDTPEGLKRITLTAKASATAAFEDKIIQTVINSGVIPAAPPQGLPFSGGSVPPVVASASMFASSSIGNANPGLSNGVIAAVDAWYRQKIIDVVPAIKEEILPFNNDLSLNNASTPISNIVVNQVAGDNLLSAKAIATGEAWYTQKIMEVMTKDGKLPKEKLLPFGGDDAWLNQ
jgi:uncharacterized Zn-binding protein involved in type VI secretion